VRLELRQVHAREAFERFGTVEAHQGHQVRLLIPRDQLTQQVGLLLSRFEVVDLEVSDPPIEELIGGLFRQQG
jgi:ABC-2 type transport system ATP-binding protein